MQSNAPAHEKAPRDTSDHDVTIIIESVRGTKSFTFSKTTKISDVINTVVNAFGFAPGDQFDLVFPDKKDQPLSHERTLVSLGIEDGTKLLLTSTGGGV